MLREAGLLGGMYTSGELKLEYFQFIIGNP